ncbi:hypothetical protein [Edaphobacter bradus]|uniref:hypothetical protein n=1 Tax=Edaphobacter bradus TaxID=2259016 RepID=UPI0021DF478A|nr:hypothetical protein [Edaphobacter bradus]
MRQGKGKRHTWYMEIIAKLCKTDERLLLATPFQLVDVNDTTSCDAATAWWIVSLES